MLIRGKTKPCIKTGVTFFTDLLTIKCSLSTSYLEILKWKFLGWKLMILTIFFETSQSVE